MQRARFAALLVAFCCALGACSSPARSTVSSFSGISGLPCGGDQSGQAVAVYRAMLGDPDFLTQERPRASTSGRR